MEQPSKETFDAIIIGVGQAGKPLALALSEKGYTVAVIERYLVGGSCINYGCTPTKTLIASARVAHESRRASDYGIEVEKVRVNYPAVKKRKDEIVEQFRRGVKESLEEAKKLTLIYGEASFSGPKEVRIALNQGGSRVVTANQIFIDCGTSPRIPDLAGLDSIPWLTSASLMELEELPRHLIILGGGYIGLEFGQMYHRFGSEVTIIERSGQLLSREDKDIATEVGNFLEEEGLTIHLNSEAVRIDQESDHSIRLLIRKGEEEIAVIGTHLLIATGTVPNTAALHLDAAGIDTDEKGYIKVNEHLETTQPGIYALGDIKGGPAFTHISYDDFRIVRQNLLEGKKATFTDRQVPYTVFTDPQLGRIGLSEKEARKQGLSIKIASMPMESVARAVETGHTKGLMKVVIDAQTDQLVGAAILGMEGGEVMSMIQIAMMGHLPYQQLRDAVFSHPTLAESLNTLFGKVK